MQMDIRGRLGEKWYDRVARLFNEIAVAASGQPRIDGWKCDAVRLKMYEEGDGTVVAEWSTEIGESMANVVHEWSTRDELMPWLEEMVEAIHHPVWMAADDRVTVFHPDPPLPE